MDSYMFHKHSQQLHLLRQLTLDIEKEVIHSYTGRRVRFLSNYNRKEGIIQDIEFFDNGHYIIYIDFDDGNQTSTFKVLDIEFI